MVADGGCIGNLWQDTGSPGKEAQNFGTRNARAEYTSLLVGRAHYTALPQTQTVAGLWHGGTENRNGDH